MFSGYNAYIVALGLKDIKQQGDVVMCGGHQLPNTVLVGGVFFGPAGGVDGAIKLGNEASTRSCWGDTELTLEVATRQQLKPHRL